VAPTHRKSGRLIPPARPNKAERAPVEPLDCHLCTLLSCQNGARIQIRCPKELVSVFGSLEASRRDRAGELRAPVTQSQQIGEWPPVMAIQRAQRRARHKQTCPTKAERELHPTGAKSGRLSLPIESSSLGGSCPIWAPAFGTRSPQSRIGARRSFWFAGDSVGWNVIKSRHTQTRQTDGRLFGVHVYSSSLVYLSSLVCRRRWWCAAGACGLRAGRRVLRKVYPNWAPDLCRKGQRDWRVETVRRIQARSNGGSCRRPAARLHFVRAQ